MGLKFVENSGGKKMYYCANCYTYLADKATVESTNFTGLTGQAYLFSRVVNARFGPIVRREMMTGLHFIRDAFCLQCKQLLGWMYELAPNDTERYKEGSVILERLRILETEGITNNTQLEARVRRPFDMAYEVANRMRHGRIRPLPQPAQNDRAYRLNDIFRFRDGEHLPVIQIFDEDHIAQTFGYNQRQIAGLRHTVDNLNDAIFQCARGNNADLWVLGFRADIGAQFIAIREIMEGNPFRPSRDADRSLVHLFDMMRRERDRMTFHNRMANPDVAELDRFYEQNAEINRAQQLLEAARLAALEAAVANTVAHENAAAPPEPEERAPNDRLYERYRNVPRAGALARVMQRDRAMRNVARRQVGNENDENMEEEEEEEGMLLVVNNNNNNNNRQNEERREAEAEAEEENPLLQG